MTMKKLVLLILYIIITASSYADGTDIYSINDNEIDNLFNNASELTINNFFRISLMGTSSFNNTITTTPNDPDPSTAFILCLFLGGFGVHRHYLGTSKYMFIWYTIGGCIINYIPDLFSLFIAAIIYPDDFESYIDNKKFIMWL